MITNLKEIKLKITNRSLYHFAIRFLICALILFYLTDGVYKIFARTGGSYRFGSIIKGIFAGVVLLYSFFTLNKSKFYTLLSIGFLICCFLIGQFFLSFQLENQNFSESFNTLIKYLSPLIYFLLVIDIIKRKEYPKKLFSFYKVIISLNSLLIIVGLFGVTVFRTYATDYRFGYDGLIYAQNEASYIFILSITTVYYRRFYLGIKESFFWVVLFPSMIVGTKAVYLFIILLFIFHLIKRVSIKKLLAFFVVITFFSYILFHSFFNKIFINSWNVFIYFYQKEGLLFALLSGRNEFIERKLVPLVFDLWTLPNFIFGGQDVIYHYMEMGFIDLILFFGLFGGLIYSYVYIKLFNLLSFNKDFKIFFGLTLFIIIFTAGHYFESAIAGFYFIIFLLVNKTYDKEIIN